MDRFMSPRPKLAEPGPHDLLGFQAKNTLTDHEQRKRYDAWRNSGLAISYKNWLGLKDSVQVSLN